MTDATVVGGLFVAIGAALAAGVARLAWLAKRSTSWPSVDARPERCTLSRGPDGAPFGPFLALAGLLFAAGWGAILGWIRVG